MSDFDFDFSDTTGMQNPIFKMMGFQGDIMSNNVTEKEILRHKNKLKDLINKLINSHYVIDEFSINKEIKDESEKLFCILNIKEKEIFPSKKQNNNNMQNNNNINMNNNNFFIPMYNQNFMNINLMQQQMMQKQQIIMQNFLNNARNNEISVIFRKLDDYGDTHSIMIQCYTDDKVAFAINKYRNISDDRDEAKKFIFNEKNLNPELSLAEAGITNNANIFVDTQKVVIFRDNNIPRTERENLILVYCYFFETISSLIEKYREKSGNDEPNLKFIFNAKILSPNLTVQDSRITNNANIFVVKK